MFRPRSLALYNQPREFVAQDGVIRSIASDPLTDVMNDYVFTLLDTPFMTNMSNLFEEYKYVGVDIVYKPTVSQSVEFGGAGASTFTPPDLSYAFVPYSSFPTTYTLTAQRGDAVVVSSMERWTQSIVPTPLLRVYDSVLADGFSSDGPVWLNTRVKDVPHFGFVIAMEPSAAVGPSPTFGGRISIYHRVMFRKPAPL
jgi:hypothetical protein